MNALMNAFSLNMVEGTAMLQVREVPATEVPADAISAVGHESTANVLSILLGREAKACRKAITLAKGDKAFVATLFTRAGAPFRPPEGVVMAAAELEEIDPDDGEPWLVATVNLPDQPPAPGCVWLKGWSENEGLPKALELAGVVRLTGRLVKVGGFDACAREAELVTDEQGTKQ